MGGWSRLFVFLVGAAFGLPLFAMAVAGVRWLQMPITFLPALAIVIWLFIRGIAWVRAGFRLSTD